MNFNYNQNLINKKFCIATPIYYVNDIPHIGHAYTTIAADVIARWSRQLGKHTIFFTGTDEHGLKIFQASRKNNFKTKKWCDRLVNEYWKPAWKKLNINFDVFTRTTDKNHIYHVNNILKKLYTTDKIYKSFYKGYYCISCEEYKNASDMFTKNNNKKKYYCSIHKNLYVEKVKEENYFFKLSHYKNDLLKFYKENENFIFPNSARNETINFVKNQLEDLSISRVASINWGIPLPWDKNHLTYVWVDALLNYITAFYKIKHIHNNSNIDNKCSNINTFMPYINIHIIGKDILRFHTIIYPAILMALNYPLPKKIIAHNWVMINKEKMSKSNMSAVSPVDIVNQDIKVDSLRFYLIKTFPMIKDTTFSINNIKKYHNVYLVNGLGNLCTRIITMVNKFSNGIIPNIDNKINQYFIIKNKNLKIEFIIDIISKIEKSMNNALISQSIGMIIEIISIINLYLTKNKPWILYKIIVNRRKQNILKKNIIDEKLKIKEKILNHILYNAIESLRIIAILINAFMPNTSKLIWDTLNVETYLGSLNDQKIESCKIWGRIKYGYQINSMQHLFSKIY